MEDEGVMELTSDHNLIQCVIGEAKATRVVQKYKWRVDGIQD